MVETLCSCAFFQPKIEFEQKASLIEDKGKDKGQETNLDLHGGHASDQPAGATVKSKATGKSTKRTIAPGAVNAASKLADTPDGIQLFNMAGAQQDETEGYLDIYDNANPSGDGTVAAFARDDFYDMASNPRNMGGDPGPVDGDMEGMDIYDAGTMPGAKKVIVTVRAAQATRLSNLGRDPAAWLGLARPRAASSPPLPSARAPCRSRACSGASPPLHLCVCPGSPPCSPALSRNNVCFLGVANPVSNRFRRPTALTAHRTPPFYCRGVVCRTTPGRHAGHAGRAGPLRHGVGRWP